MHVSYEVLAIRKVNLRSKVSVIDGGTKTIVLLVVKAMPDVALLCSNHNGQ